MSNLDAAMKAEEGYISNRLRGIDGRSLIDIIADYGFESLTEYHEQKSIYQLTQTDFVVMHTTDDRAFTDISAILTDEQPTVLFEKHTEPFVYLGSKEYNAEAIENSGIKAYDGGYLGGTIVGGAGDLSVGIFYSSSIDIREGYLLGKFAEILQSNGVAAVADNNDILADGKKVIGTACLATETFYGFVAYISFSDNTELVTQICGESEKKPGYITGMTVDEFMEAVRQWLL